ncbi:hypothetical protein A2U01_0015940, partial [Trifolium medium]|nr:hypothetical protein [Trifolium medium]
MFLSNVVLLCRHELLLGRLASRSARHLRRGIEAPLLIHPSFGPWGSGSGAYCYPFYDAWLLQCFLDDGMSDSIRTGTGQPCKDVCPGVLIPWNVAKLTPDMQASYTAWLLVAGNENLKETSIVKPSSLSRMSPAPLPLLLENPSVNTVQLVHGSLLPGVSSARKSVNTCAFSVFRGSNETSNSESSTDHLVICPSKSGRNSTCFK